MKSIDGLLSNFYHEGSWSEESSNIFVWNLAVKQGYAIVADFIEEIVNLELLTEEKLAFPINRGAIGASTKIGNEEAVQWLHSLKMWAINPYA